MKNFLATYFKRNLAKFKTDSSGNFMMIAAVGLPLAIFAIGSAVDYANFLLATRQVQAALDSASFAATRAITVEDLTLDEAALSAREQLMLNIANLSFIDAQAIASSLRLEHDKEIGKLTAIADLQTPTLFAGLFGYDNISTTVVATNQVQSLEMSFVLDNTGSMSFSFADGSSNKNDERIIALRAAMYNAVDRLLPAGRVNDNRVRVSITPYSDAVNLGQFYQAAVGEDGPDRGSSCVTEREGMEAFNDIAPDDSDPDTLYETDVALNPDHCINSRILPLTDDREDLFSAIDRLDTKGRTAGHIGITWGLNTLSGEWRLFWPSSARPARYLTTNVTKILIVMTDGTFNTTYFDDKAVEGPNGDLGRGGSANETTSENATREFCDLAKDPSRGVRVYTVTLGTSAAAGALMAECATNASTAFIVTTGDELDEAFEQIVIQARTPILTD